MDILIDNKSGAPIYDQIYSQIKAQIISGALKENEALFTLCGTDNDDAHTLDIGGVSLVRTGGFEAPLPHGAAAAAAKEKIKVHDDIRIGVKLSSLSAFYKKLCNLSENFKVRLKFYSYYI